MVNRRYRRSSSRRRSSSNDLDYETSGNTHHITDILRSLKEEIEHRGISDDTDRYDRDIDNRRADEDRDGLALLQNFFRGPQGNKRANVFKKFIGILSDSEDL